MTGRKGSEEIVKTVSVSERGERGKKRTPAGGVGGNDSYPGHIDRYSRYARCAGETPTFSLTHVDACERSTCNRKAGRLEIVFMRV